jgi:peptide/nickel transport system permease protein
MAAQLPSEAMIPGTPPLLPPLISTRRLRRQGLSRTLRLWVPAAFLILLAAMCFLLPVIITIPPPTGGSILDANAPLFSPGHILGADPVGNDVFSRICYGGRVAFEVALAVTAIGVAGGCLIGITAGYFGGWVDAILSRVLDVMIAFPAIVLAIAIAEGLQPSEFHTILALLVFAVPATGRISRGATLTVRELPFMLAARLSGTKGWRVMVRHVIPNVAPTIATFSLLGIGVIVIIEGALDFLGYGIQPPAPSWGNMIAQGQTVMDVQPQYVLVPSLFLLALVVAVNALGDALRERWGVR